MRGVYTVQIEIASVSTAKTLLYGTNDANTVLEILGASVTDEDQSTAEQLRFGLFRVTTAGSPAGASADINKTENGSSSSIVTWLSNLTAEPTTYATDRLDQQGVLNVGGYYYDPLPEVRKYISPSKAFGLKLLNAPTNAVRLIAQITYRELGG